MTVRAYLDHAGLGRLREPARSAMRAGWTTSTGIHLVADGLAWRPGDEIVVFDRDFPANVHPWRALRDRGVRLVWVPMRSGGYRLEDVEAAIGPATRLVAVSHVNFATGFRIDLGAVCDLAHRAGALVCVDALQSLGVLAVVAARDGGRLSRGRGAQVAQRAGGHRRLLLPGPPVAGAAAADELLANNARYAETFTGPLPLPPAKHVAVVACMDARINVYGVLGLGEGEAYVIRNAGGVITADEIRSLAISQRLLGTREIILIHHTDCGILTFTDDDFKKSIQDDVGVKPAWAAEAFDGLDTDVRQSIARIRISPFIPHTDSVRGFVFDVATGRLNEVG